MSYEKITKKDLDREIETKKKEKKELKRKLSFWSLVYYTPFLIVFSPLLVLRGVLYLLKVIFDFSYEKVSKIQKGMISSTKAFFENKEIITFNKIHDSRKLLQENNSDIRTIKLLNQKSLCLYLMNHRHRHSFGHPPTLRVDYLNTQ